MSTNTDPQSLDAVLARLAKEVESAVHALYRRQAGPHTTQVRTDQFVKAARERLDELAGTPRVSTPATARFSAAISAVGASAADAEPWTQAEAAAVTRCITAWLPMGSPSSAQPDSRCVPPGRELMPTWGEREIARQAVRKVAIQTR